MKCKCIPFTILFLTLHFSSFSQEFVQIKKMINGDTDNFGRSVSISNDYAIVGAKEDDEFGSSSGAAYIYSKNLGGNNTWGLVKKLTASDASESDEFGVSVSISNDIVIIGAINNDDGGSNIGSAYIFSKDEGGVNNWGEIKKLKAINPAATDEFGASVSINGNTAVVGAYGINYSGCSAVAYVFSKNEGGVNNWGQVKILDIGTCDAMIAPSVSTDGTDAIIGTRLGPGNSLFINDAAFIFSKDQGGTENWGLVTELISTEHIPFNGGPAGFGYDVSIDSGVAIVGSIYTSNIEIGDKDEGAAYLFSKNDGGNNNWGQIKKLFAFDGERDDEFGTSVSINGNAVIIGVPEHDASAAIFATDDRGAAYTFAKDSGGTDNWGLTSRLINSDSEEFDHFGESVSVSGDFAIVGLKTLDGAAYIFESCLPLNLNCPSDLVLNADLNSCIASGVNLGVAMFDCSSFVLSNDAPLEFPIGVSNINWTIDNGFGTNETCIQTVTINENGIPQSQCNIFNCGTSIYITTADVNSGVVPALVSMKQSIGSDAQLNPSDNFTFQAGQFIQLDGGFEVVQNAAFHALIASCN